MRIMVIKKNVWQVSHSFLLKASAPSYSLDSFRASEPEAPLPPYGISFVGQKLFRSWRSNTAKSIIFFFEKPTSNIAPTASILIIIMINYDYYEESSVQLILIVLFNSMSDCFGGGGGGGGEGFPRHLRSPGSYGVKRGADIVPMATTNAHEWQHEWIFFFFFNQNLTAKSDVDTSRIERQKSPFLSLVIDQQFFLNHIQECWFFFFSPVFFFFFFFHKKNHIQDGCSQPFLTFLTA